MKRIISFGVVTILIVFMLSGCDKELSNTRNAGYTPEPITASEAPESTPEPNVKVTLDGEEIEVMEYSTFGDYLTKYPDLPYTEPESEIEITFSGDAPDTIKVTDLWIGEHGKKLYDYAKEQSPKLMENDGVYSFVVFINLWVGLDSLSHESVLRGFEITCKWGKEYEVYRFVLKTGTEWTTNTIPDSYARDDEEE
jgi:hypothetical protein